MQLDPDHPRSFAVSSPEYIQAAARGLEIKRWPDGTCVTSIPGRYRAEVAANAAEAVLALAWERAQETYGDRTHSGCDYGACNACILDDIARILSRPEGDASVPSAPDMSTQGEPE